MPKTATVVGRGHRSRTLSEFACKVSFIRPRFENVLSPLLAILRVFVFALIL